MIEWGLAAVAVLVIGVIWFAAQGRFGAMPPLIDDRPGPDLPPDANIDGDDLRNLRLAVVTRGYSMAQVDDLLDRLAGQLDTGLEVGVARRGLTADSEALATYTPSKSLGWPGPVVMAASSSAISDSTQLGWPA
jgi:DivIVA domain-containing protein